MAKALAAHKIMTCIHKHYSVEQWAKFIAENPETMPFVAVTGGISEADFSKISEIIALGSGTYSTYLHIIHFKYLS